MTMKPTNFDSRSCGDIIASNCVTWTGPDLPCIGLCKGDSVTTVVYKLAEKLCELINMFDIDAYDLTCFNITACPPKNFQELIQFLILKICELYNLVAELDAEGNVVSVNGTSPDQFVMNIAECFYYQNPQGDTVTTMTLTQYVTAIGNEICDTGKFTEGLQNALKELTERVKGLETIESSRETVILPTVTPVCIIPGKTPQPIGDVVRALEAAYCELVGATGSPISLFEAITRQCIGLSTEEQLAGPGTMGQIEGWSDNENVAQTLTNIWLTMCDLRAAVKNIQLTCCPSGCDDIELVLSAVIESGTDLKLFLIGTVPVGFTECNAGGTFITIRDASGGTIVTQQEILSIVNNMVGLTISLAGTPVNPMEDITIDIASCFKNLDTGEQCKEKISYFLSNTAVCPTVTMTPALDTIAYSFTWTGGAAIITVTLYDTTGTAIVAQHITAAPGAMTLVNVFTTLASDTNYRLEVSIDIAGAVTNCPKLSVTTLTPPCSPPTFVASNLVII